MTMWLPQVSGKLHPTAQAAFQRPYGPRSGRVSLSEAGRFHAPASVSCSKHKIFPPTRSPSPRVPLLGIESIPLAALHVGLKHDRASERSGVGAIDGMQIRPSSSLRPVDGVA